MGPVRLSCGSLKGTGRCDLDSMTAIDSSQDAASTAKQTAFSWGVNSEGRHTP